MRTHQAGTETLTSPETDTPFFSTQPPCYFAWAREKLPDISAQMQKTIQVIQPQAKAYAEAYGENCIDGKGDVVYFATLQTDFYITLKVKDLADEATLGKMLEQTLIVLDQFPLDKTPGHQPGNIGITFESKGKVLKLWFTSVQADEFRRQGFHGADLFNSLRK